MTTKDILEKEKEKCTHNKTQCGEFISCLAVTRRNSAIDHLIPIVEKLVEHAKQEERENWDFISDNDSCECDNCNRRRRYLQNPKKEIHREKQRAEARNPK